MMTPTPEQIQYAERWCKARGKIPEDVGYGFAWNDLDAEPDGLPWQLYAPETTGMVYGTEEECVAALAVALAEMRAVVGVEEEVLAERERCAVIAETYKAPPGGWTIVRGSDVAGAIRKEPA